MLGFLRHSLSQNTVNRTFILACPPPHTHRSRHKTKLRFSTCLSCGGASRGRLAEDPCLLRWQGGIEKLAGFLSPRQPLVKLFSPGSWPDTSKIGRGHTGIETKSWAQHRILNSARVRENNRLTNIYICRNIFLTDDQKVFKYRQRFILKAHRKCKCNMKYRIYRWVGRLAALSGISDQVSDRSWKMIASKSSSGRKVLRRVKIKKKPPAYSMYCTMEE
jgi:hypothetical protein